MVFEKRTYLPLSNEIRITIGLRIAGRRLLRIVVIGSISFASIEMISIKNIKNEWVISYNKARIYSISASIISSIRIRVYRVVNRSCNYLERLKVLSMLLVIAFADILKLPKVSSTRFNSNLWRSSETLRSNLSSCSIDSFFHVSSPWALKAVIKEA